MSESKSIYLKRFNGTDWDNIYYKTRMSDIINLLDDNNKIKLAHLPASIGGGMRYVGVVDSTTVSSGSLQGAPGERLCKQIFGTSNKLNWYNDDYVRTNIGKYVILTSDVTASAMSAGASTNNKYTITIDGQTINYQIAFVDTLNSEDASSFEKGDWLIFDHYDSSNDIITYYFSVLNNTYREATTTNTGIIKLSGAFNASSNNWGNLNTNVVPTAKNVSDFVTGKGYVVGNSSITGGTKCKITYDSKGLVTSGADLEASDIPDLGSTYLKLTGGALTGSLEVTTQLGIKNISSYVAEILSSNITATRTYNLPDKDGTFAMVSDIPTDYQPQDADLTAIAGLSGNSGFLKKTAANTWSLDTTTYQPQDADLTAIAGLSGNSGLLKKTAANTWALDTTTYLSSHQSLIGKANVNIINGSNPASNSGYSAGDIIFTTAA